jgi:hypothetical protein
MAKSKKRIGWAAFAGLCGLAVGGKLAKLAAPYLGYHDSVTIGIAGGLLGLALGALAIYGALAD